jgi:hypothetical protein
MCLVLAGPANAQRSQPETAPYEPRAFEVAPRGYVELDWRSYVDWDATPGSGRLEHDTFEVRRLRGGIEGGWRRLAFEVMVDPQDLDGTVVKDAYAQISFGRAFQVRAGQFKLPGSREYQVAARNLDFLERSALASSLAGGRDIGVMLRGDFASGFEYQAGFFVGDGNGRASRAGRTAAGRVSWKLAGALELGASSSLGRTEASDPDPANGFEGRTSSGYRFFERVYVQGRRLRVGADASWQPRGWRFSAEVLRVRDERLAQGQEFEDLPPVVGSGWSLAATRRFGRGGKRPQFSLRHWNLSLRADGLMFDDEGPTTDSDSVRPRASDVRAKSAWTATASARWEPTRWAAVLAEATRERYDDIRSAPRTGSAGPYWAFGARLLFQIP